MIYILEGFYFSWMFADCDNKQNLKRGYKGYLVLPSGEFVKEPCYEGYGRFNGVDPFAEVVRWNREFLATHPEHTVHVVDNKTSCAIKKCPWYPILADLKIPFEELEDTLKNYHNTLPSSQTQHCWWLVHNIGVDIADQDENNASLPYPIKITKTKKIPYEQLPASKQDPSQGE